MNEELSEKMTYIWPDIRFEQRAVADGYGGLVPHNKWLTTLRKKHEDKWYLVDFFRDHRGDGVEFAWKAFISDVVMFDRHGVIIPDMKNSFGELIHKLDPIQ